MYKFYVIGSPIKQSKSPAFFNYIFNKLDLDAEYKSKLINNNQELAVFIDYCKQEQIKGINITMPQKKAILSYITDLDETAQIIKSINCICFDKNRVIGHNSDYYGFSCLLKKHNITIEDSNNIVLGSGGSARSIILSLIHNKANNIYILSRNKQTAKQIIDDFSPYSGNVNLDLLVASGSSLNQCNLINCTPIGMLKEINSSFIQKIPNIRYDNIIDINYNIEHNYFDYKNNQSIDGKSMFIFQALKSLDLWFESNISDKLSYQELYKILC